MNTKGGSLAPVMTRLSTRCMGTLSLSIRPLVLTIPILILFIVIKLPMDEVLTVLR